MFLTNKTQKTRIYNNEKITIYIYSFSKRREARLKRNCCQRKPVSMMGKLVGTLLVCMHPCTRGAWGSFTQFFLLKVFYHFFPKLSYKNSKLFRGYMAPGYIARYTCSQPYSKLWVFMVYLLGELGGGMIVQFYLNSYNLHLRFACIVGVSSS